MVLVMMNMLIILCVIGDDMVAGWISSWVSYFLAEESGISTDRLGLWETLELNIQVICINFVNQWNKL